MKGLFPMKKILATFLLALFTTLLLAGDKVAEQIIQSYKDGSAKKEDTISKLKSRAAAFKESGDQKTADEILTMIAGLDANTDKSATASKLQVPADADIKAARSKLRDTFKDDFAKKKDEDKLTFSKSLREMAATEKDTVQKYALFLEAIALYTDTGNIDEALAAVVEMCAAFDTLPSKEKGLVLAVFAKKASKPEDFKILVDRYLTVVNEAMGDSDPVAASDLLKDCKPLASKSKDKALSDKIADKTKEVAALAAEKKKLAPSIEKLKESPDDPDANLVVGRYECFVKGDWDKGLPILAKSSDETLKAAVKLESEAAESEQIAKAADAWWASADKEKTPAAKVAIKAHASELYGKALPNLTGVVKATAEKRIAQSATEVEASGVKLKSKSGGDYLIVDLSSRELTYSATTPPDLLKNDKYKTDKLVMRRISAGEFMMGKTGQQHKVTLTKDFYIGVFEVTQGQWKKVMKANPSGFKDAGKGTPVESVTWYDCQTFMKELNGKKSSLLEFRLPTEAEWEYACRGGTQSKGFEYSGSGIVDEVAWLKDNSGDKTHPVGRKKPNELGLYDMSGNVWEWCQDFEGDYPKEAVKDPVGAQSAEGRGLRGGSWGNDAGEFRCAYRHQSGPSYNHGASTGLRLCLGAPLALPTEK